MFILLLLFFIGQGWALGQENTTIRIELGEDYLLPKSFKKIWIENKSVLWVQEKNFRFYLKSLAIGESNFRLDNKLYRLRVYPGGTMESYRKWTSQTKKFVGLNVSYCADGVCLGGRLFRFADFTRIIEFIRREQAPVYLNLETPPELQAQIRSYYDMLLREQGFTPQKILFTTPWKVYFSKGRKPATPGLLVLTSENTVDISENIKVSVKIVELNRSYERKLGIRWPDSFDGQILNNSKLELPQAFDIAINAAEKSGDAHVLASPNLICRNGKEADFFAGGEFPIKVVNLKSSSVIWKRYGISLKLKPLVDSFGQMSLQMETEVSSVDRSVSVDDLPALHVNRVASYFDLVNKRTIALSGLIKNESSENSEGLPFLKSLPVLGNLFRSKNFQENKSELVIFVTPELLKQEPSP